MIEHVEILVEEPSMAEALRFLLPKVLGTVTWTVHDHRSKDGLLKSLPGRLQGYAAWLPPEWRVVVIVDRDDEDCEALKAELETMAANAGLAIRSSARGGVYAVVNRVAIEELEAWYFGDWQAVRAAYGRVGANIPKQRPYRDPDAIAGGTWEALERVLQGAGYFRSGLLKMEAARQIARHMDPARNTSRSFRALRDVLYEMMQA